MRTGRDLTPSQHPQRVPWRLFTLAAMEWAGQFHLQSSLHQLEVFDPALRDSREACSNLSVRSHPLSTNKWLVFLTGANHSVSGWPRAGISVGGGLRLHPLEPGWQPFSRESTAALDMPRVVFDGTEREKLGDLGCGHGVFDILLVGKDQY